MNDLKLYTDGSSDPWSKEKPARPGGWAYVVQDGDMECAGYGSLVGTGESHMEFLAVERGLAAIEKFRHTGVEVITDSGPVRKWMEQLMAGESPDNLSEYTELAHQIVDYMRYLEYVCLTVIENKHDFFPQHKTCHDLANLARKQLKAAIREAAQTESRPPLDTAA